MQSVKILILCSLLMAFDVRAEKLFGVLAIKKYTKQTTEVLKNKNELYCSTELTPYFVIAKADQESVMLTQLANIKKEFKKIGAPKSCERNESVIIQASKETYSLCLDNPVVSEMIATLAKNCGRNF
jgi:hypothetical protein